MTLMFGLFQNFWRVVHSKTQVNLSIYLNILPYTFNPHTVNSLAICATLSFLTLKKVIFAKMLIFNCLQIKNLITEEATFMQYFGVFARS